jgi:Bacterial PH domain
MVYRSKKDWWLYGLVWAAVLAPLAAGLFNLLAPGGNVGLGWELQRCSHECAATRWERGHPCPPKRAPARLAKKRLHPVMSEGGSSSSRSRAHGGQGCPRSQGLGRARANNAIVRAGVVAAAAVLLTTCPLNYEINATELVARSGFMRWRVPLGSIQDVSPSRNPASAPAWSLDRLRVEYSKGAATRTLYVSPEDKAASCATSRTRRPALSCEATAPCESSEEVSAARRKRLTTRARARLPPSARARRAARRLFVKRAGGDIFGAISDSAWRRVIVFRQAEGSRFCAARHRFTLVEPTS